MNTRTPAGVSPPRTLSGPWIRPVGLPRHGEVWGRVCLPFTAATPRLMNWLWSCCQYVCALLEGVPVTAGNPSYGTHPGAAIVVVLQGALGARGPGEPLWPAYCCHTPGDTAAFSLTQACDWPGGRLAMMTLHSRAALMGLCQTCVRAMVKRPGDKNSLTLLSADKGREEEVTDRMSLMGDEEVTNPRLTAWWGRGKPL